MRRQPEGRAATPFFSVVTVTRDRAPALERALQSLQAQDERSFEHVVVDGASTDGTAALLASAGAGVDVWLSEPDRGIADALNKAIALSCGQWIVLLHSDDRLVPGALRHWRGMAGAHPQADLLSCGIRYVDAAGAAVLDVLPDPGGMPSRMALPHPGMAVRRSLYERIGMFDTGFRVAMDYEFTLRAIASGARVACDATISTLMGMDGISQRALFRSRNENLRARMRYLGLQRWMIAHYLREMAQLGVGRLRRALSVRRWLQK